MKIAALKIQQQKLGLSDARYRKLLNDIGGVRSSKELSPSAANKVYSTMCQMAEATTPHQHTGIAPLRVNSAPSVFSRAPLFTSV